MRGAFRLVPDRMRAIAADEPSCARMGRRGRTYVEWTHDLIAVAQRTLRKYTPS